MNIDNKFENKKRTTKAIINSFIMFLLLAFFFLYNAKGLSIIASWITTIYLTLCYFMLQYTEKISYWRKFLFIAGAFCFFPSFIALLVETRGGMVIYYEDIFLNKTPFCHIVFPMVILPYLLEKVLIFPARLTGHFASFYAMLVIILISTLTIGKGWCSWVCFYGGWDESFSLICKKPIFKLKDKLIKIRFFNFVILFVVILGSLATFSVIFCQWLCPWKLITEYNEIKNASTFFAFIISVLIFAGIVITLSLLTKKRFHCMSFCPFGALASIFDKISVLKVKIDDDKCIGCVKCVEVCPIMSIDEESIKEKKAKIYFTCTKCGSCIDICPQKAISYAFSFTTKKNDLNKNIFYKIFNKKELNTNLVIFSGWLLGSIIMGGFMVGTLTRILNLFVNGSFLIR